MGWYFEEGQTRQQLISKLTAGWASENGARCETLAHCTRGNVLWTVREYTRPDTKTIRVIGCDLMQKDTGYGWGYKDMEETSGPSYYSCPTSYLDMATEPENNYSRKWREEVRRETQEKKKALELKKNDKQTAIRSNAGNRDIEGAPRNELRYLTFQEQSVTQALPPT